MTIPLIQQPGPFQQLQATVDAILAERERRKASALEQLMGQAQMAQTEASTARTTGETNRAQQVFERTQQQNQEIENAVGLVRGMPEGSPGYDQAMASALATLKAPEQITRFRDALEADRQTRLTARRRQLYGGLLQKPTLENLTRAYEVALREGDEDYARMLATMISSHGYLQEPSALQGAQVEATKALTEQRRAGAELASARKGWGPSRGGGGGGGRISPEDRAATELRRIYLRFRSLRNSRTGAPAYRTDEEALNAAIERMGVNATPAVVARVRAAPTGATSAGRASKTPAQWVAEVRADPAFRGRSPAEIAAEARRRAGQ